MAKQTFTTGQVLTAAQVNSLQTNDFNQTVNVKTASYVLVASDKGTRIEFNTSGSVTCTVNTGLFDAGDTLIIQNRGTGAVTVTAGTATVDTSATLVLSQYDSGTLYFISSGASIFFNSDAGGATPLTTKGDLYTFGTSDTRLAVGNNGETLVADSSTSTGLRWQGNFAAGKNKIINGDFRINQRSFTSTTTSATFGQDRWFLQYGGGTTTYSNESFTAGAAPVAGYEGTSFARLVSTSQSSNSNYVALIQKIEDVRTFANQTVTISFWAKASTGTPNVGVNFVQTFGSGGSADVVVTGSVIAITSSWARYSATIAVPSISGKTIGTGSNLQFNFYTSVGTTISGAGHPAVGLQNVTVDVWGVQIENGSVATAFQTATGTLAGELAACQRYYYRFTPPTSSYNRFGLGQCVTTTTANILVQYPVSMRTAPTALEQTGTASNYALTNSAGGVVVCSAVPNFELGTTSYGLCTFTVASGLTAGNATQAMNNLYNTAYLGWSAEL